MKVQGAHVGRQVLRQQGVPRLGQLFRVAGVHGWQPATAGGVLEAKKGTGVTPPLARECKTNRAACLRTGLASQGASPARQGPPAATSAARTPPVSRPCRGGPLYQALRLQIEQP